jgi:hypothetical protein
MALRHIPRHRMPVDGTWVRTEARLDGIIRCEAGYDDSLPPESIRDSWVPIWVRMELYKAQETPKHPDGMIYGPVIKLGSLQSPEIPLFGHHCSAGLSRDGDLDGWDATDSWLYHPLAGFYRDEPPPGEDVSQYECDRCQQWLYRDDTGRRHAKSACISDGGLVCRDCEVTGMVYAADVEERLAKCRALADFLGEDCRGQFERQIEHLGHATCFGHPAQTRVYLDSHWSFYWICHAFTPTGKRQAMNGGLILHGPCPRLEDDGSYRFTTWDYSLKCEREATTEEVSHLRWGIHT